MGTVRVFPDPSFQNNRGYSGWLGAGQSDADHRTRVWRMRPGRSGLAPSVTATDTNGRVNAIGHAMVAEADVEVRRCLAGIVLTL